MIYSMMTLKRIQNSGTVLQCNCAIKKMTNKYIYYIADHYIHRGMNSKVLYMKICQSGGDL